jgi:hypothetical protein
MNKMDQLVDFVDEQVDDLVDKILEFKDNLSYIYNYGYWKMAEFLDSAEVALFRDQLNNGVENIKRYIIENNIFNPNAPQNIPRLPDRFHNALHIPNHQPMEIIPGNPNPPRFIDHPHFPMDPLQPMNITQSPQPIPQPTPLPLPPRMDPTNRTNPKFKIHYRLN